MQVSNRLYPIGIIFACWVSVANSAVCEPGAVTGLFRGADKPAQAAPIDVMLNLFCAENAYTGQLFTSMGDFAVKDARSHHGLVDMDFDSGASLGTLRLVSTGKALNGIVDLAGEHRKITLNRVGPPLDLDAMKPNLDLSAAEWRADLHFLAAELPSRHANAFFLISRATFDAEVAVLNRRIEMANSDEIFVGLQRIVKSIGDGHTGIDTAPPDRRVMPLQFAKFGTDFRVSSVGSGLEQALGARLLQIGGIAIPDVWQRVLTLTSQGELMELRREVALVYLSRGYALHGLDVIPDRNHAIYTLKDDSGRIFDLSVQGLAPGEITQMKSGYSDAALRFQRADQAFWCQAIEEKLAVYCAWRGYQKLDENAKEMFTLVDQMHPKKLIIDMRDNGGGDNTVGEARIVGPIAVRPDLNSKGRLYVLIGPKTFSAAMNNAAQFQDETRAITVGETIGEKPNSYQEPRQFRLPHSHLVVRASTIFYRFRKTGENAVRPDKEIIPTWEDIRGGSDPVLDWVLSQRPEGL
jgi:Peptidase family S41